MNSLLQLLERVSYSRHLGAQLPAPKITIPSLGEDILRCAGCGGMSWQVHVSPQHSGPCITEIGCRNCQKVFKLNRYSIIEINEGHRSSFTSEG